MTKQEIEKAIPYRTEALKKSNYLIGTKYKASVYEHKLTYLAMMKVQHGEYNEKPDGIYVSMDTSEIKAFIGFSGGSFYERLKETANDMTGNNMGIVDDENQRFMFITLINQAIYERGWFHIRFANELRDKLIGVTKGFTLIPSKIASALKNKFSFPLYQLLKSHSFYPASYRGEKTNVFTVNRYLSELKLDLGVVDSNAESVRRILSRGKGQREDFDKAVGATKEKMFEKWADFKRRCLDPAVEDINAVSDIYCTYTPGRAGKGGKVVSVDFTVYLNGTEKTSSPDVGKTEITDEGRVKKNLTPLEIYCCIKDVYEQIKEFGLLEKDAETLCETSDYDIDAIKEAILTMESSRKKIDNVMGFLISAIQNGYQVQSYNGKAKKNAFNNFKQNSYDFDELEKMLVTN